MDRSVGLMALAEFVGEVGLWDRLVSLRVTCLILRVCL